MTPTTKAGKECNSSLCKNGRVLINLEGYSVECSNCHGLRWLPAPGDALTAGEAEALWKAGIAVEYGNESQNRWFPELIGAHFVGFVDWRVAPAPKEDAPEEMVSIGLREIPGLLFPIPKRAADVLKVRLGYVDPEEPAAKGESVCEMFDGWRKNTSCTSLCDAYVAGFAKALSLTPAQLDALRKERE